MSTTSSFGENALVLTENQVDPDQNAPEVEKALRDGGNDRAEVAVLPGLNHLFQHAETGSPLEYGAIEETFAPALRKGQEIEWPTPRGTRLQPASLRHPIPHPAWPTTGCRPVE